MKRARAGNEPSGFSLVELLIVMAILSVVLVGLGGVLIAGVRNQAGVAERMNYSHNANLLATYLNADLASADVAPMVESAPCSSESQKLQLRWSETQPDPNGNTSGRSSTFTATYSVANVSAVTGSPDLVLQRTFTTSGLAGSSTNTTIVVHGLSVERDVCTSLVAGVLDVKVAQGGTSPASMTFDVTGKTAAREVS